MKANAIFLNCSIISFFAIVFTLSDFLTYEFSIKKL